MRTLRIGFIAAALTGALSVGVPAAIACPDHDKTQQEAKKQDPAVKLASASFQVKGMMCEGCTAKVKAALAKVDGVAKVDVKLADKRVMVSFDPKKTSTDKIAKVITDLGFPAAPEV